MGRESGNGPWSDGSKEWTPFWVRLHLSSSLGLSDASSLPNSTIVSKTTAYLWMTYADMLNTFTNLYRTRLFDDTWTVTQQWTGVNVAWLTGYLQKKFVVEVKEAGTGRSLSLQQVHVHSLPCVMTARLMSLQLDSRYFQAASRASTPLLLHFILQKKDSEPGDYVCRVRPKTEDFFHGDNRSVSCAR